MERDIQAEIKQAQADAKTLGAYREKMVGDARVEESKAANDIAKLKSLGVLDADELSVEQIIERAAEWNAVKLEKLDAFKVQAASGKEIIKEYEEVTA